MNTVTGSRTTSTFLEFHANSRPNQIAVVAETNAGVTRALSWRELDDLVNQTANWILAQGLESGHSIVLHVPNSLEFYLFWLACGKTRTVAVPVDPASTAAELQYIVDHSDARLVVTVDSSRETAEAACKSCPKVRRIEAVSLTQPFEASSVGKEISAQTATRPSHSVHPLDPVGMLYTSGTTGRPKGVILTHSAYLYGAEVFARSTGLGASDRHLIALPLYHAAAQCHAMTPSLVAGASIVIVERFSTHRFFEQAIRHGATRAALFGAPLRMLLRHYASLTAPRTPLELATFAQNLTREELNEWETKFDIPLMQLWGMTETVGLPLMAPLHGRRDNMCMGLPVAGYEVKIVDDLANETPAGVAGEIVVRAEPGWTVTSGYYKNPQATSDLIRDGWLYSGDRALRDSSGQFHFLGRFKELIKRSGENISPIEVEDVLKTHPSVQDAAVVGVPDAIRDERVIAFVILRHGTLLNPDELREWCLRSLSPFKVPEEYRSCDEFPRTSVGKVQRHLLRKSHLEGGYLQSGQGRTDGHAGPAVAPPEVQSDI